MTSFPVPAYKNIATAWSCYRHFSPWAWDISWCWFSNSIWYVLQKVNPVSSDRRILLHMFGTTYLVANRTSYGFLWKIHYLCNNRLSQVICNSSAPPDGALVMAASLINALLAWFVSLGIAVVPPYFHFQIEQCAVRYSKLGILIYNLTLL